MPLGVAVLGIDRQDQPLEDVERPGLRHRASVPIPAMPDGVAAAGLRLLQRQGGDGHQPGHRLGVIRIRADARAEGQRQALRGLELEGVIDEGGPDPVEDAIDRMDLVGREDDEKLVRTVPAEHGARRALAVEEVHDREQGVVTGRIP